MWILFLSICAAINVFLVPHTHIDTGWVLTVDEYYIVYAVPIIVNLIALLEQRPSLKFVWSEAVYLHQFLSDFAYAVPKLQKLISEGRFEIVGGGWVMNDEALVDFESLSRQMLAGHRFYKEVLGVDNITIAWQIDPFGHSSLTPAIFEKMGFEYIVINRIDEDFKVNLI